MGYSTALRESLHIELTIQHESAIRVYVLCRSQPVSLFVVAVWFLDVLFSCVGMHRALTRAGSPAKLSRWSCKDTHTRAVQRRLSTSSTGEPTTVSSLRKSRSVGLLASWKAYRRRCGADLARPSAFLRIWSSCVVNAGVGDFEQILCMCGGRDYFCRAVNFGMQCWCTLLSEL